MRRVSLIAHKETEKQEGQKGLTAGCLEEEPVELVLFLAKKKANLLLDKGYCIYQIILK